ncbi:hypothetical protein GQ43DRAFT_207392 [Delitschia confertaspora ATCC 74209]|uniref:Zn(2)-C6 fungal-type domain-containing protein n=1 Tax=Delitschia confertaspora ATCC 74209 TaxID=1513339 RepID=A0A9P4JE16_9PLEO|nr:hypothetical protein GQ43DRAFT_207392 [Delitschia confertaspora ATCC 74209]
MDLPSRQAKPIDRVPLACTQCRSRHVKCDSTKPACGRCKRDGKECAYLRSRRGGLDKAALARRRLTLQQASQQSSSNGDYSSIRVSSIDNRSNMLVPNGYSPSLVGPFHSASNNLILPINTNRLIDLYFEKFHPAHPFLLPRHPLNQRRLRNNHGLGGLLSVLHWILSVYSPYTQSEPYMLQA